MIYYLTPFCPQKRIGHIHNKYCELVTNPDDYICLLDPDVMFLNPHQQSWIQDIVDKYGNDWDLLGCMTNRIGIEEQQQKHIHVTYSKYKPIALVECDDYTSDITNAKVHRRIADSLYEFYTQNLNNETSIYPIQETGLIAGFFMLFKRSLWDKIKFKEGINFDIKFCEAVKKKGGRIGIMKGIYVYHDYRSWSKNPKTDKKHLL